MTTEVCTSFLKHLADDADARAHFVELLRSAACLLDGSGPEALCEEPIRTRVAFRQARALRDAAASLCDHARTHGAHCRYCEVVLPFATYDTDILARSSDG